MEDKGQMINTLYIADSRKKLKYLIHRNYNAHDIFMTIRCYNKMLKLQPERSKRENTEVLFEFEDQYIQSDALL